MSSPVPFPWTCLPTEIKHDIALNLPLIDAKSLARASRDSYQVCLPFTFQTVYLHTLCAVDEFLRHVPAAYGRYTRSLKLTTDTTTCSCPGGHSLASRSVAVSTILAASLCLEQLTLNVYASLNASIIAPFSQMYSLRTLAIRNMQDESFSPLSERLVTSLCLSVPNLQHLSLTRISRSSLHAREPNVAMIPLVQGDHEVPSHPLVGSQLNLPQLLRIPSLTSLVIEDTHLGDPQWVSPSHDKETMCKLESLTLGTYLPIPESTHQAHVLAVVESIAQLSHDSLAVLNTQCTPIVPVTPSDYFLLPNNTNTKSSSYLGKLTQLKRLELGREVPLDGVLETMETFSNSPIEQVVVGCWEDEVVERCQLLEDFLMTRGKRGRGLRSRSSTLSSVTSFSSGTLTEEDDDESDEPLEQARTEPYFDNLSQLNLSICTDNESLCNDPSMPPLLSSLASCQSLVPPSSPSEKAEQLSATKSLFKRAGQVGVKGKVFVSNSLLVSSDDLELGTHSCNDWFGLDQDDIVSRTGRGRSVSLDTALAQMERGFP